MKRIKCDNIEILKKDYLNAFDGWCDKHQRQWYALRYSNGLSFFPERLQDILIAKPSDLAEWYYKYVTISLDNEILREINRIFRYKGQNRSTIAEFFMNHSTTLGISTCHYCESAYVNAYRIGNRQLNHFDIDHFLPKSMCPIISLSLFNLVPSCPVCNERLKRELILGDKEEETSTLNPWTEGYDFDNKVEIIIIPLEAYHSLRYQDNPEKFEIVFKSISEIYQKEIKMFKLEERYGFHKCEALRLLDLMQDYPESHINMICELLGRTPKKVFEDIFSKQFVLENKRMFSKLHQDIIKTYK